MILIWLIKTLQFGENLSLFWKIMNLNVSFAWIWEKRDVIPTLEESCNYYFIY